MLLNLDKPNRLGAAAARQARVIYAVMLRNIRTRFFGHGLGYLIAIAWPVVHVLILVAMFASFGRAPPYGESIVLFVATGSIPFMIFSYLSRFMQISLITTRPLFVFPEVKVLDVLFASALLEILSACFVTLVLIGLAWLFNVPAMPRDVVEAAGATFAAVLLGAGFGILNGVIALSMPLWATLYALFIIVFWMTSGVLFVPDALPEPWRTAASYQPVLQVVEWMRAAYYEGYGSEFLDRAYAIEFGLGSIFFGLLLERATRGHVLALR